MNSPKVWFRAALVVLAMGAPSVALAGLRWDQPRLVLEPPVGAAAASGRFTFVNTGTSPVRVVDVQSGCGCTTMVPQPETVLPGESGSVQTTFHVGERRGRQTVAVVVSTEEPEPRSYDLVLEVLIKDFVALTPRLLYWRVGEDAVAKTMQLTLAKGFEFVAAEGEGRAFTVEIAGRDATTVQLRVRPSDTWAKRQEKLTIQVRQPGETTVETVAVLRVL